MSTEIMDQPAPGICVECENDHPEIGEDGMCAGCRNVAEGYCRCGAEPMRGYSMCGECSADEYADYVYHSQW